MPHDGPCTYVGVQGGPVIVYRCQCGKTRELLAAQPELDRRAALTVAAQADKTLRALKEAGRSPKLPWYDRRRGSSL